MRVKPSSQISSARNRYSLRSKPASQDKVAQEDKDWIEAGSLMKDRGIEPEGHSLLQENVASYLAHRSKNGQLPTGRWRNKLDRDLDKPYSDDQVLAHIDKLQSSLQENLQALPSYPKSIFVTGSFSKGRIGANSDLNGYAVLPAKDFQGAFTCFEERHQQGQGANLFPMSANSPGFNKAMMLVEGTSVKLSTDKLSDPEYLKKTYLEILDFDKKSRKETSVRFDGLTGKMWRSKFERETFHFRAMRWALHLGGSLCRIPYLGDLLEMGFSKIVKQQHRNLEHQPQG